MDDQVQLQSQFTVDGATEYQPTTNLRQCRVEKGAREGQVFDGEVVDNFHVLYMYIYIYIYI